LKSVEDGVILGASNRAESDFLNRQPDAQPNSDTTLVDGAQTRGVLMKLKKMKRRHGVGQLLTKGTAAGLSLSCVFLTPHAVHADDNGDSDSEKLAPVIVRGERDEGYRKDKSSLGKLTEDLRDTPQAITVVTREELDDRGVTNLNDALRTVPGITLGAGETSYQGNNASLRGFTTRNDVFLDGTRDYGYYNRDPFNYESVEVLKGPNSTLFGRGSTGGVIHEVSKAPTLNDQYSGTLQFGTDDTKRATIDAGGAVKPLGAGVGYRFNAVYHESGIADRDAVGTRRWGIAPSLAFGLGTPTRLTASYLHQQEDSRPDYGIPWFAGRPANVKRSNYYGFDSDYLNTDVDLGTLKFEHDFNDHLQLHSQARYSRSTREFRYSEAIIPAGTAATTPPENITVNRNEFQGYSTDRFAQSQTDLTARFNTGKISHTLVSGIEIGQESPNPTFVTNTGLPTTNLANPERHQPFTVNQNFIRLIAKTRANGLAAYFLDTIKFDEQWQLIAGLRWDRFEANYHSTGYAPDGSVAALTDVKRVDEGPSYRAALVYKPVEQGTVYFGYGDSFNPSAEGIESLISAGRSVAQANLNLDAEKSRTFELGTKWELAGGRLLLTSAIFRTEKTNARVPDPNATGFNTLGGEQRVDGFEIEASGRLTSFWKVRAGYTYLDSETVKSVARGPIVGAQLLNTPRNNVTAFTEFELPAGFEVGLGLLYVSSRLGQNTSASYLTAPGYVTLDGLVKYRVQRNLELQLNVLNLTNEQYFDQLHPVHVIPGAGRTALFALNWRY